MNSADFEIVLHFVNKDKNPAQAPDVKKYRMINNQNTRDFLKRFSDLAKQASKYY